MAATTYGLFRSDDGGTSWRKVLAGALGIFGLAANPHSPSIVLASDYGSIYRSIDGGDTWAPVKFVHSVSVFAFDPANPLVLYAGASSFYQGVGTTIPGTVYRSLDGGSSWTEPDPSFQRFNVADFWDLLVDPRSAQTLIAVTQAGTLRSGDGAQSWNRVDDRFGTAGTFSPDDNSLFVTTARDGFVLGTVLRSQDGGLHFEQLFTGFGLTSIVIDPLAPLNIYAGGSSGVVHTLDGGITWSPLNDGLPNAWVNSLAIDPRTSSVFAGTRYAGAFKLPLRRERASECLLPRIVKPRS